MGEEIFSFVFGNDWLLAGHYASILMPGFSFIFVVSTLSPVFSSTGHLKISATWNVFSFIVTFVSYIFFIPNFNIENTLHLISLINVIIYTIYLCLIFYAIYNPKEYKK